MFYALKRPTRKKKTAVRNDDSKGIDTAKKDKGLTINSARKPTGPSFYDPRRPYKYWTGKDSKHKSYQEAIQALAEKYQQSVQWIQANMGDTNDLEQIHQNLANNDLDPNRPAAERPVAKPGSIAFYNPRREFPYWTSKETKHKSYREAIQTLARKYEQSAEWIQANMGNSNDLNEIHQELTARSKIN